MNLSPVKPIGQQSPISYTPSPAPSAGSTPVGLRQPSGTPSYITPLSGSSRPVAMINGGARPSLPGANYLPVNLAKQQGVCKVLVGTVGSTDSITASLCVDQYNIGFFLYLTYNLKQNEANIMSTFCVVFIFLSTYASLCLNSHILCYVRQWDFLQIRIKCKRIGMLLYLVRYYSLSL